MKTIFLYVVTLLVIGLLILFLIVRSKARRQIQKSNTNILKLKNGKANYEFDTMSNYNDSSILKIKKLLEQNNFRIIENVNYGLIAYFGKSENASLSGWLNVEPLSLPLRIVVAKSPSDTLIVKFADDYGFQILNSSQKQKFNDVYKPVFTHYETLIRNQLN